MVVVNFGHLLAWEGAHNSTCALNEQTVEGDRSSEEEGVECWRVETFTDEGGCSDDQDGVARLCFCELSDDLSAFGYSHATLEDVWAQPSSGQPGGKDLHVRNSSGQNEAVPTAAKGPDNVVDYLFVSLLIGHEGTVYVSQR